jgi:hypothetical protein
MSFGRWNLGDKSTVKTEVGESKRDEVKKCSSEKKRRRRRRRREEEKKQKKKMVVMEAVLRDFQTLHQYFVVACYTFRYTCLDFMFSKSPCQVPT